MNIVERLHDWVKGFPHSAPLRLTMEEAADYIVELERQLADMTNDYMRRHKDAGDEMEKRIEAERQRDQIRAATIEECAKVCDLKHTELAHYFGIGPGSLQEVARAIRALGTASTQGESK